ncbi:MAG: PAS domain-containing protein [Bryobacterales bacterium]|nr:PAS domain-containing protein [Bryobacterales bacterium]MBV9401633.1 PAS domain-containing protein [Bryobacterales bacterium]
MAPKIRSAIFQRLFWCSLLAVAAGLVAAIGLHPASAGAWLSPILAGVVSASLMATLLARGVDRKIARMREFAESLLQAGDEPVRAGSLDQLEALDRSLLRMAGQTRTLVERAKLESARREAILSSMVEGVLAVDDQLRVTFCNQALARLAGTRMPGVGTPLMELVRDVALQETLADVIRTGEPAKRNLHIPVSSSGRSFELQAAPLITGNKPGDKPGAIAILHDITDLERLERIRNDFVANVSHEFRTPLAAISGYAETLLDGALEDPQHNRRFLEIINSNAIRLSNIAADLLTLSELQTGAPKDIEPIPVADALESALSTVAAEASRRGVSIERGNFENVTVSGSRYRLEQALVNLLANAVKFNRPGGSVRAESLRNGTEVRIVISDTGVGIPSNDLPRIFERFYRVDKGRSREVGGTGLGLSIVKHIVERMHGSVSATSQLGKGSAFTVTLPLA